MSERLFKYLPIAVGLVLGWFLTSPPEWIASTTWARFAITAGLVVVVFVAFAAVTVAANLPSDVSLTPAPEMAVTRDLGALADRLLALGFRQAGPLLKVGVKPPALLFPFVHETEHTYATVFRTDTVPAKTAFEFVSLVDGPRAGLNSSAERTGGYLPASPGSFKQLFPGMELERVFDQHRQAIAYLGSRGLPMKATAGVDFPREFKRSLAHQRTAFLGSPLVRTLVLIYRSMTSTTPHLGPLRAQRGVEQQIQQVRSAPTSS